MERYSDYTMAGRARKVMTQIDVKELAILLAVEFGMLIMAIYKGIGLVFAPITLSMMVFTIIAYTIVSLYGADITLLVIVLVLINLGFLIQQVEYGGQAHMLGFLEKLLAAIAAVLIAGLLYHTMKDWFSKFYVILFMMLVQLAICVAMFLVGKVVGSSVQSAQISIGGITPFEIVKFLYVFVAAGLLCNGEEDGEWIRIFGLKIYKEIILVLQTMILSVFFILCSELGTMFIIYITGLMMLWMFGKNRKRILFLILISIVALLAGWALCDMVLLPMVTENPGMLTGVAKKVVTKVVYRFGTALHPEYYRYDYGHQGTCGLEAIAEGGLLGIGSERYRLSVPEADNDFVFANIVQTCGLVMGIVVILFFFFILNKGMKIAENCKNEYYRGVASAISIVITVEAVIHIGYNIAAFPVTGIPMYFLSHGFMAIVTGMVLIAVLLVITADNKKN